MAVTFKQYNQTAKLIAGQQLNLTTLRCMLLNNTAAFDATHTTLAGPAGASNAKQVSGNGWTAGGEFLTGVGSAVVTTNDVILDCNDIAATASGGSIGPAYAAVIYDDSLANDQPLWYIDFGEAITAGVGTPFLIVISSNGLFKIDYTLPA